jgi:hypothetical protein
VFSGDGIVNIGSRDGEGQNGDLPVTLVADADGRGESVQRVENPAEGQQSATLTPQTTPPDVITDGADIVKSPIVSALEEAEAIIHTEDSLADDAPTDPVKPEDFLQRWAAAWSDQDVEAYLAFYGEKFIPPAGRTRQQWEKQRHQRLTSPKKIKVHLDNFKITSQSEDKMKMEAIQSYQSDILSDKTRKVFDLQRDGQSWKIIRERSLGVVR